MTLRGIWLDRSLKHSATQSTRLDLREMTENWSICAFYYVKTVLELNTNDRWLRHADIQTLGYCSI
jgi:hypothetical protein